MSFAGLSDYLDTLESSTELLRVRVPVEPGAEIAEVTTRVAQSTNQAIVFEKVTGRRLGAVTNLLGTERRLCLALGVHALAELAERVTGLLKPPKAEGLLDKLKLAPQSAALAHLNPKRVRSAPCQQVVRLGSDVRLGELPIAPAFLGEQHAAITAAQLWTRNPETRARRLGWQPAAVLDDRRLALAWSPASPFAESLVAHRRRGERMPVALVLGGDPGCFLTGQFPAAPDLDPVSLMGLMRGQALELVKCRTHDVEVPADAELVIEGFVDAEAELAQLGSIAAPFGSLAIGISAQVFEVTAITERAGAVFPVAVFTPGANEVGCWRRALERVVLPLAQLMLPELVDWSFPDCGGRQRLAFVAIRKTYPQQARRIAGALWALAPWMSTKLVVIVDEAVDVHGADEVWRRVAANVYPPRDVFTQPAPADWWDHATPQAHSGANLAIDATAKLSGEHPRDWPAELVLGDEVRELASRRWAEYELGADPGPTS
ncbi:MAG: UbiD family decarboxylase [Pirellulales bacterium]|nr:UbiD family decarboxylase [Pirellulales bacterium]